MATQKTTSLLLSIYRIIRRHCKYNVKCFTSLLLVIVIALNLILYTRISPQDWPNLLAPELDIERREINPLTWSSRHPFPEAPEWMEGWLLHQRLEPSLTSTERKDLKIDIVYTWVNGSDSELQLMKEKYQDASPFFRMFRSGMRPGVGGGSVLRTVSDERENPAPTSSPSVALLPSATSSPSSSPAPSPTITLSASESENTDQTANRFRDLNELKYSVRSVAQYAGKLFQRVHILATQVDASNKVQVPAWLDSDKSEDVIRVVPHGGIFETQSALPSFNSLAIESQMHHIPDITNVFMYLNDDVFLGTPILPSDVWTPLYGFVFHLEPSLLVPPQIFELAKDTVEVGEWNSLTYSNYLLSKQFGARHRAYLAHIPHVLSTPMLQEIEDIWPEEFAATSSHRFRGEGQAMDIQVSFFMAHYVLERLRETQLTSYWLYRLDANQDGVLDWSERKQLIQRIELWNSKTGANDGSGNHPAKFSSFLEGAYESLQQLGYEAPNSTVYRLAGLDGYPFMLKNASTASSASNWDKTAYNYYEDTRLRTCNLNIDFCLGPIFTDRTIRGINSATSSEIFQRLAFTEFHCGDCLLHMLRMTATEPGLASEIMPLDKESVAFSTVSADLARYSYVIGTSDYSFVQLREPDGAKKTLDDIWENRNSKSFICINDNISSDVQKVQDVFQQFLDTRFSIPSPWEKLD